MTEGHDSHELVTVELLGLPVDIQVRAQQHGDELTREMVLIAERLHQQDGARELPARFVSLVTTLSTRYAIFTAEQDRLLAAAAAEGRSTLDLTYRVPASAGAAAAELSEVMAEADDYCRQGQLLLTLETPAVLVTYRRWFLDQFVDQTAGRPPVSWADYAAAAVEAPAAGG